MNVVVTGELGRDALDALPHPVLALDCTYRVVRLNSEAENLLDLSSAELLGKPIWDVFQSSPDSILTCKLEHAFFTGERIHFRYFYPRRKSWLEISAKQDATARLVLTFDDATDVRTLEHELDSMEHKVCDAFRNAAIGVAVADENGRFLEANQAFTALTGYSLEELRARDFVSITHAHDREKHVQAGFKILHDRCPAAVYEKRYIRKDGVVVWVRMNVSVLSPPERNKGRYIALCEEITLPRAASEELRLNESRFRALIERSLDLITVLRPDGSILYESPAIQAMLGYTPEELIGKNCFELIHPDDLPQVVAEVKAKVPFEALTARIIFRFRHKNGSWRYLEGVGRSLLSDPAINGIVVNSRDITESVETKQKLNEALAAAREATDLKSRFLANMSHEIRTPMNGVVGLSELLLDTKLTPEQREYVEGIQFSADLLLRVINDILDFSKIEAGKLEVELAPFDLREALAGVGDIFDALCRAKGLNFELRVASEVPTTVLGDGLRVRQVITNLLSNAVKFTAVGSVVLSAEARPAANDSTSVRVSVRDTGIGIPPEHQRRLFSSFTQGDSSTTRKFGGTGLGLAISKQLLELMGGRIGLESAPGHGTEFWFELPVRSIPPFDPPRAGSETSECASTRDRC